MLPLKKAETQSYVLFDLGPFRLGVGVNEVASIIELPQLSRLPMMPDFVTGSFMYQGHIASLVDLHIKFNISPNSEKTAVMVSRVGKNLLGFKVDQIHEMIKTEDIQSEKELPLGIEMLAGITDKWGVVFLSTFQALLDADAKLFVRGEISDYQQQNITEETLPEALHLVESAEQHTVPIEHESPLEPDTREQEQELYEYALGMLESDTTALTDEDALPEVETEETPEAEPFSALASAPVDEKSHTIQDVSQEPKRLTHSSRSSRQLHALTNPHPVLTPITTKINLPVIVTLAANTKPVETHSQNAPLPPFQPPMEPIQLAHDNKPKREPEMPDNELYDTLDAPIIPDPVINEINREIVTDKPVINDTKAVATTSELIENTNARPYKEQKLSTRQRNIFNKQRPMALPFALLLASAAGGYYFWQGELNTLIEETPSSLTQPGINGGAIGQIPEKTVKLSTPPMHVSPFVPVTEIKGQNFSIQIERQSSATTALPSIEVINVASGEPNAVLEFQAFVHNKTQAPEARVNVTHTVVQGESLWKIASRYLNNPYRYPELAELSNIKNPDLIYVGDRVIITSK